jgi:ActD protein
MRDKNIAVFGIYPNRSDALAAVETLKSAGFRNTDISVLVPDNPGTKDLALEKDSKAPEGATAGGITGGVIGGALAWLAGIGALSIPGIGPFIAAGPIMGVLGGIGVGGAIGGLAGALIGLGIPEYEAKRYEGRIRKGGILLSVHCDNSDWMKRAKSILDQTGAEDISSAQEAKADFAASDRPMSRALSNPAPWEPDPERPLAKPAADPPPIAPADAPDDLPRLKTPL